MTLIDLAILVVLDRRGRQALRIPSWSHWPALVGIGFGLTAVTLGAWALWFANRTLLDAEESVAALGMILAVIAAAASIDLAVRVGLPRTDRQGRPLR